jgi:hypothetical protein
VTSTVQQRHTASPRTGLACGTGPLSCGTWERMNCIRTDSLLQRACQPGARPAEYNLDTAQVIDGKGKFLLPRV